jgi:beta-glucosidase
LSDLDVATRGSVAEGTFEATVTVTITNTGTVDGAEVVQVYVADVESSVARPVRELRGFAKASLAAGTSRQVSIELDQRAFAFWSVRHHDWVVEAGDFVIAVGSNSRDLPLTETVTVEAPGLAAPLNRDSTLQEWMSDPIGRQLIEGEVKNGQSAAVLEDELISVIGNMPMSTLANFGGMSLDHDALDRVSDAWRRQAEVG